MKRQTPTHFASLPTIVREMYTCFGLSNNHERKKKKKTIKGVHEDPHQCLAQHLLSRESMNLRVIPGAFVAWNGALAQFFCAPAAFATPSHLLLLCLHFCAPNNVLLRTQQCAFLRLQRCLFFCVAFFDRARRSFSSLPSDSVLRAVCTSVSKSQVQAGRLKQTIADMRQLMHTEMGCGLAAPQVGIKQRLFIIEDALTGLPFTVMINPRVAPQGPKLLTHQETCLSVPDVLARGAPDAPLTDAQVVGQVTRPACIKVHYLDELAQERIMQLSGFWATIVQHELDHLNGVLFTDKLDRDAAGHELRWNADDFYRNDDLLLPIHDSWLERRGKVTRSKPL